MGGGASKQRPAVPVSDDRDMYDRLQQSLDSRKKLQQQLQSVTTERDELRRQLQSSAQQAKVELSGDSVIRKDIGGERQSEVELPIAADPEGPSDGPLFDKIRQLKQELSDASQALAVYRMKISSLDSFIFDFKEFHTDRLV
jgi:hypothetical protein